MHIHVCTAWQCMTIKKCPHDISFFFCTQHANNNVQRLLLANKCDAEDERRVWKDQGARVSFDIFFFSRKNVHVHVWEHFINLINLLLTVKTKPNKKPVFYYTRQNLQIYNSHPFADKVKFCSGIRCSSFTRKGNIGPDGTCYQWVLLFTKKQWLVWQKKVCISACCREKYQILWNKCPVKHKYRWGKTL